MKSIQPRPLQELPTDIGFRVGYSRISDGNMSYSFGLEDEVLANREAFFRKHNAPAERLIPFFTEHQEIITDLMESDPIDFGFDGKSLSHAPRFITDVIVSNIRGAGMFLGFADCVPFVVYDRRQHLLAFAHIGWRSMALGLTGKLIRHLFERHQSRPEDLYAVIGPSIKPESYHFADPIQAQYPVWKPFLQPLENGKFGIDLFGFCLHEIASCQLPESQVFASLTDTAKDPELFSHYAATVLNRPEKQGRFFFYGWLEE
jgi:copper oxidase (laccase) domain-containing protein